MTNGHAPSCEALSRLGVPVGPVARSETLFWMPRMLQRGICPPTWVKSHFERRLQVKGALANDSSSACAKQIIWSCNMPLESYSVLLQSHVSLPHGSSKYNSTRIFDGLLAAAGP